MLKLFFSVTEMFEDADDKFFGRVLANENHVHNTSSVCWVIVYVCVHVCAKSRVRRHVAQRQTSQRSNPASTTGEVVSSCHYLPVPQETMPALCYWNSISIDIESKA